MPDVNPTSFGRLERLPATAGWVIGEAGGFTPWLAANLQELGDELGLILTLKGQEYPVGRYSLDLLLEDANQRVVIVENQFHETDHSHLGQLLTYAAGVQADVVVWIAEKMTEEHVAALEWLNDGTISGVGFFGVELELLRIGNSPLAPHFRVVVKPNDWRKRVRPEPPELVDWGWDKYESVLHIPAGRLEVARQLFERVKQAVADRNLTLIPAFRKGYIPFQRSGGYNVVVIGMGGPAVSLSVKLPATFAEMGIEDPYPGLKSKWREQYREWDWMISSLAEIPDISAAIDLAHRFMPSTGGMAPSAVVMSQVDIALQGEKH